MASCDGGLLVVAGLRGPEDSMDNSMDSRGRVDVIEI
jgi:hypothetical protein